MKKILIPLILILALALGACGKELPPIEKAPATNVMPQKEQTEDVQADATVEDAPAELPFVMPDLYVIRELDSVGERITVTSLRNGNETRYGYTLLTEFCDKYGTYISVGHFQPGTVVEIETQNNTTLTSVKISDAVWIADNVDEYSMDFERGVFRFNDSNYRLPDFLYVFSEGEQVYSADIKDGDVLSITGYEKEILSVRITTSDGTLQLINTGKFDGSWVTIGLKIFAKITPEMSMPLAEGEYTLTVANNGYGGSTDIVVKRGEKTVVDLSELEGEGPKICKMRFAVDNENCRIYLDGGVVDNNSVKDVPYGTHRLVITADGYDNWARTLVVNSPTAEISVGLSAKDSASAKNEETGDEDTDDKTDGAADDGTTDRLQYPDTGSDTPDSGALSDDSELDYYTTLSSLIGSLLD